ncbi:Protein of unknown function [Cruoricaptor ignavus]|uniref:DUF3822 domain-containing protein n=2 Tax=Cruoricaptor ignavus TaxID=1118202 RepID=A0A1M6A222_9FLAO|nr:Protein of unknown function [Cruoricaptor ignavus]
MMLNLLFTKDGLQYRTFNQRKILEEKSFFADENSPQNLIFNELSKILKSQKFTDISVISAINHFTLMPAGFKVHDSGFDLIALNADVQRDREELMLSVNRKYAVQFYYSFPLGFYREIKSLNTRTHFNFSGEKFLNALQTKAGKEIHVNLYYNQCEFFALDKGRVILYNNLDANSEVDFLYFVMFTLKKLKFEIAETKFFLYGEVAENETFTTELQKFAPNVNIVFANSSGKNFMLS